MKLNLKQHVYNSNKEKIIHYLAGFFGWMLLGYVVVSIIDELQYTLYETFELHKIQNWGKRDMADIVLWIPMLVFVGALAYYMATKYWAAIGLATTILVNLVLFGEYIADDVYIWVYPSLQIFGLLLLN